MGPNFKRLVIHKMSTDAVPSGGGLSDAVKFLQSPDAMRVGLKAATKWVETAILAVRQAGPPNPWTMASDEDICGEILRQVSLSSSRKSATVSRNA